MPLERQFREYRSCSPEIFHSPSNSENGSVYSPPVVVKPQESGFEGCLPRNPELIFPAYQDRSCPQPRTQPPITEQSDNEENMPLIPANDIEETMQLQQELVRQQRNSCSSAPRVQSPPYSELGGAYVQHIMGNSQKSGYAVYIPRNPELLFPAFQDRKNPRPHQQKIGQPGTEEQLQLRQDRRQQRSCSPALRVQSPSCSEYGKNNPQSILPLYQQPIFHQSSNSSVQPIQKSITGQFGTLENISLGQELRRTCPPAPGFQSCSTYQGGYQKPVVAQPQEMGYPGHLPSNSQSSFHQSNSSRIQSNTGQPRTEQGMLLPRELCQHRSCPPGLEYLNEIDQVLVHQGFEIQDMTLMAGTEASNKYTVKNSMGEKVFYAIEKSDYCERFYFGANRSFVMNILDHNNQEVIHLNRPLACTYCLYPCCLQNMEISAPPGTVIGSIQQDWTFLTPKFHIQDETGEIVFTVKGPAIPVTFGGDLTFQVYSKDGLTKVGKIIKLWGGVDRGAYTNADMFDITFPLNLNVKYKAILLGTCFLIDFIYFENFERRRPRR